MLPGGGVGVAGVPGAALPRSPAPIMQRGLGAVVRRTTSCWREIKHPVGGILNVDPLGLEIRLSDIMENRCCCFHVKGTWSKVATKSVTLKASGGS